MRKLKPRDDLKVIPLYEAFSYQKEAFEEIKDLPYSAIFHEQGLGKTKIAIDLMSYWLEAKEIDTVLVITKKQLIANWRRELAFHTGILPEILNSDARNNYYVLTGTSRIVLTNFETVVSEKSRLEMFLKSREVAVIIDESARLKNPETNVSKALFELSGLFRIKTIMSGTPIANRPFDIWAQIFFLDNGDSLGNDFSDFKSKSNLTNNLASNNQKRSEFEECVSGINDSISAFTVRETKSSSGVISLPSKTIHDVPVDPEQAQAIMYAQLKTEMSLVVVKGDRSIFDDSSSSLKRMTRLIEVSSNPAIIDESYECLSGKEQILDHLLNKIMAKDERVIVWSAFIYNIDYYQRKYKAFNVVKIHGKLNMEERNRAVTEFVDGNARILFATPQSAKEGLTLTSANHAIFYDRGFNLDDYLQAQDRIHRISQTKECHVYNLIMNNSIDVWIDKLLIAKKNAALLGQGDITLDKYQQIADYSYSDMVKDVLGISGGNDE